jgi:hypothetical protein
MKYPKAGIWNLESRRKKFRFAFFIHGNIFIPKVKKVAVVRRLAFPISNSLDGTNEKKKKIVKAIPGAKNLFFSNPISG